MDPITAGAIISGGSALVGGMLSNESNANQSSISREWQGDQERSGREFSERMSSTAHQRQVKDLKAAGLNPILSAMGGASAPQASGGSTSTTTQEDAIGKSISTAMETMAMKKTLEKQDAEIALAKATTNKTNTEAKVAEKGIPESDFKNRIYESLSPIIKRFLPSTKSSAEKSRSQENMQKMMQNSKHNTYKLSPPY